MAQPTPSDVHVNAPLTNLSVAYLQDQAEFIADQVFPAVPVMKQSDRYFDYGKGNWFRASAKKRAPSTESAGSGFSIDNTPNYFCDVYAIHKDVDDYTRSNADTPLDMDRDSTEFVSRDLVLTREVLWAAKFFTTSVWTGSTTGSDITVATAWDVAGSTPIADMRAQIISVKKKTGFRANKVVLGQTVWNILQDHPDFLERIKYTQTGIMTTDLLAAVLGVEKVYVGGAVQNTSQEPATDTLDFVFSNDVLICYAPDSPGILKPSAGYTFVWTGLFGMGANGMRILRFRLEWLRSDRIEGEMAFDQKVVSASMGAFLSNVVT